MSTFYQRFVGQTHHLALVLFAGWGAAGAGGIMYKNYHPTLPAEPEDPAEFDKLIADITAAAAESDAANAAAANAH